MSKKYQAIDVVSNQNKLPASRNSATSSDGNVDTSPSGTEITMHSLEFGSAPTISARPIKSRWVFFTQFIIVVFLPTLFSIIYFGFMASERYVSTTQIVIQSAEMGTTGGLQGLLGGASLGGTGGGSQGDILATYIHSISILEELENLLHLRKIYAPESAEKYSKLTENATLEEFLTFYKNMTVVEWDSSTSLLMIQTQAFSQNDAKLVLDTIILLSENKLNSLTERKQRDRVAFAKKELEIAEERLRKARLAVANFRSKYGEIDPVQSAQATGSLLAKLQAKLAEERAALGSLLFVMKPNSPQVLSTKSLIRSLELQVQRERQKATKSELGSENHVLSDLVTEYEGLVIEEEFARATYTSALSFLENTRATAQQDSAYVVDFVSANLPDQATEPKRLQIILATLIVSLLTLGIGKLIVAAIREQARL